MSHVTRAASTRIVPGQFRFPQHSACEHIGSLQQPLFVYNDPTADDAHLYLSRILVPTPRGIEPQHAGRRAKLVRRNAGTGGIRLQMRPVGGPRQRTGSSEQHAGAGLIHNRPRILALKEQRVRSFRIRQRSPYTGNSPIRSKCLKGGGPHAWQVAFRQRIGNLGDNQIREVRRKRIRDRIARQYGRTSSVHTGLQQPFAQRIDRLCILVDGNHLQVGLPHKFLYKSSLFDSPHQRETIANVRRV